MNEALRSMIRDLQQTIEKADPRDSQSITAVAEAFRALALIWFWVRMCDR